MIRKYKRNCRKLFPVYGRYERRFMERLEEQIKEYIVEVPDATYEILVEQFGSPKDIVLSYYESISDDYLLKKTNLAQSIKAALMIIVIVFICFWSYRTYMLYQAYQDAKATIIIHEKSTIEELPSK